MIISVRKLALATALAAIAAGATVSSASADVLGVSLGATPGPSTLYTSNPYNLGYSFTPNEAGVSVTALGVFDNGSIADSFATQPGTGTLIPELVGLWDQSGNLIASATVTAGATQIGSWAFTGISPVTLTEGDTYVVGAQGGEDDFVGNIPVSIDPKITYIHDQWITPANLASLVEPTMTEGLTSASDAGWFGGNIEIADVRSVPEPMSLTLLGAALVGLGVMLRRRKQA